MAQLARPGLEREEYILTKTTAGTTTRENIWVSYEQPTIFLFVLLITHRPNKTHAVDFATSSTEKKKQGDKGNEIS